MSLSSSQTLDTIFLIRQPQAAGGRRPQGRRLRWGCGKVCGVAGIDDNSGGDFSGGGSGDRVDGGGGCSGGGIYYGGGNVFETQLLL